MKNSFMLSVGKPEHTMKRLGKAHFVVKESIYFIPENSRNRR
jgi:hypothetical protein